MNFRDAEIRLSQRRNDGAGHADGKPHKQHLKRLVQELFPVVAYIVAHWILKGADFSRNKTKRFLKRVIDNDSVTSLVQMMSEV